MRRASCARTRSMSILPGDAMAARMTAGVALAGQDAVARAEILADRFGLGRRLDDDEIERTTPTRTSVLTACALFGRRLFLARRGLGPRRANGGGLLAAGRGSLGVTR